MGITQLPADVEDQLPTFVKVEVASMAPGHQQMFLEDFYRKRFESGNAYGCWLLFGLHYGYLGQWGMQVLYWAVWIGTFWMLCLPGFLWWLIDAFRLSGVVKDRNAGVATEVLTTMKAAMGQAITAGQQHVRTVR